MLSFWSSPLLHGCLFVYPCQYLSPRVNTLVSALCCSHVIGLHLRASLSASISASRSAFCSCYGCNFFANCIHGLCWYILHSYCSMSIIVRLSSFSDVSLLPLLSYISFIWQSKKKPDGCSSCSMNHNLFSLHPVFVFHLLNFLTFSILSNARTMLSSGLQYTL